MTNVSNLFQILNYWMLSKTTNTILVGSDLCEDFEVNRDSFHDYLLSTNKIGRWYCDSIQEEIVITMNDILEGDEHEFNELLDEFIKLQYSTAGPEQYNNIPFPVSDPFEGCEVGQRPLFEEYELQSII